MAFKIRPEEFAQGEKFIEIIPADYGKCVCLKANAQNQYELIKYQSVGNSIIAKALAYHLAKDNVAIDYILVKDKVYKVPKERTYAEILQSMKEFLQTLDSIEEA